MVPLHRKYIMLYIYKSILSKIYEFIRLLKHKYFQITY
jgi:hypothetical protein